MKLKKKIFAIVICTILVSVFTLGTFATSFNSGNLHLTEQPIRDYSKYMPADLPDQVIENMCNFVNGDNYVEDEWIEEIRHCGTVASLHINYHYNKACKNRSAIPQYLSKAYNKINSRSLTTYSLESNYSVTSDTGRFIIQYDLATGSNRIALANLLASIFDGADMYLCGFYGFDRPTTTGTAYIVKLVSDSIIGYGTNGETNKVDSSTPWLTYIEIKESLVNDFYNNADDSFVLGVAIHEYWHAILNSYGIHSASLSDTGWFHESTARAIGIEYELEYARSFQVCDSIRSFLQNPNNSIASSTYHYGAALFELSLFESYDEWYTLVDMLENYNFSKSIMENIDITLQRFYNSNLDDMYSAFRLYNVSPDTLYFASPYNRLSHISSNESWGNPYVEQTYSITNSSTSFSGTGNVNFLAVNYVRVTSSLSTSKNITLSVSASGTYAVPRIGYVYYDNNIDCYIPIEPAMTNGTQSSFSIDMSTLSCDDVYVVISNAGTSGPMQYSYNISINN